VILVLSSCSEVVVSDEFEGLKGMVSTLGRVAGFVVAFTEPVEVLVFNPWHPCLVLFVVVHFASLGVGRLLAVLFVAHGDDCVVVG